MKTYGLSNALARKYAAELSHAEHRPSGLGLAVGGILIVAFYLALAGGALYGLVRFVKWAWMS
jgi:hypothetical protein